MAPAFVFSWDNPLMQCIASQNGRHSFTRSYVEEEDIFIANNENTFCLHNWKLSTYLNCLSNHGFFIEQVVEESEYEEKEADAFQEGRFYAVLFNKKEQILSGGLLLLVCIVSGEVSALFDQIKLSYKFIQHGSLGG